MTQASENAINAVNELEIQQDAEGIATRTHEANFAEMGARPAPTVVKQVLERRWRRKNDINSLQGLVREHARVISAIHRGRLNPALGEILSRAYGRHREMVSALQELHAMEAIRAQLEQLGIKSVGAPGPLPLLIEPAGEVGDAS